MASTTVEKQARKCLIIGATGAQGIPVVRALSQDGAYKIRALTRSITSANAKLLLSIDPTIEFVVGSFMDEATLIKAFNGVDVAFVNTDGFTVGEMRELYWGIRIFELAARAGVKHYVWGSLDYVSKKSGYDPRVKTGHYDGKGKIADWMSAQPTSPMNWSVLTSGPYIEMLSEFMRPKKDENGTYVFAAPLGDGAIPFIHLHDLGLYARWIFDHPEDSRGLDLEIATEHVNWNDLAKTFTKVTGKPAIYKPLTLEEYFAANPWGPMPPSTKVGGAQLTREGITDPSAIEELVSYQANFSGFWTMWARSGYNTGLIRRDYALLDKILPNRVKSAEEWMKKVGYDGEPRGVLKSWASTGRTNSAL